MGHHVGRFEQQQAALGCGGKEPSPTPLLNEMFVILRRFESKQRELETVLAVRLTVTAAGIAAQFREDGRDLIGEVDRHVDRQSPDHGSYL